MGRTKNNTAPLANATEERLRATPFTNVGELDAETKAIRLAVWRRFAEAKIINELMTKPELRFVVEEWREGLIASFGINSKDRIFKVYSEGKGLRLEVNKALTEKLEAHEAKLIESIVRAGIEGFGLLYLKGKSIVGDVIISPEKASPSGKIDQKPAKRPKSRAKKNSR
jgi:hypothetical protein